MKNRGHRRNTGLNYSLSPRPRKLAAQPLQELIRSKSADREITLLPDQPIGTGSRNHDRSTRKW